MEFYKALKLSDECGLQLIGEALSNVDIHAMQLFLYSEIENEIAQLSSEWNTVKMNTNFTLDSKIKDVVFYLENTEKAFRDEIGGIHDEGLGWNPNGVFCGECNCLTCVGCLSKNIER